MCRFFKNKEIKSIKALSGLFFTLPLVTAGIYFNRDQAETGYICLLWFAMLVGQYSLGYMLGALRPCPLVHAPLNLERHEGEPEVSYRNHGI